jgi:hypothetical protein
MTRAAAFVLVVGCATEGRPTGGSSFGSGIPELGTGGASTSSAGEIETTSDAPDASTTSGPGPVGDESGPIATSDESGPGAAADDGGTSPCSAPDVLVVLDRTLSMHRRPDGSVPANTAVGRRESKWFIAIDTLERITAELEGAVNFGLELFPREPPGDFCVTLEDRIAGIVATNPQCEAGEPVLEPQADAAGPLAMMLDHETTRLCHSTPIGHAVQSAVPVLAAVADPDREQFVVLVSDGNESCDSDPVEAIHALAATGVRVYAVGFGDILDTPGHAYLNQMACAGRTAVGFPAPCVADGDGNYDAADPDGDAVYLAAEDADALDAAFDTITADLCCGSACVPG